MREYSNVGILNHCPSNHWQMSTLSDAVGGANLFEGVKLLITCNPFGDINWLVCLLSRLRTAVLNVFVFIAFDLLFGDLIFILVAS